MNYLGGFLITVFGLPGCAQAPVGEKTRPTGNVGDIFYDPDQDSPTFVLCDSTNVRQYYVRWSADAPPSYEGEKPALVDVFISGYSPPSDTRGIRFVTIRFAVNCRGESGRFRVETLDEQLRPAPTDDRIVDQLLTLTRSLTGWVPRKQGAQPVDFYQYLTFRVEDGVLTSISP